MGFILNLVVSSDTALIVRNFNTHFDNPEDPLKTVAVSILDTVGVKQNVIGPTRNGGHTLDLILTIRLNIKRYSKLFTVWSYFRSLSHLTQNVS